MLFLHQFASPLIYVLFAAAAVIYFLHGIADAIIIAAVLLFNAAVGTFQEGKAQNTLQALRNFLETKATVYRDSEKQIIPDTQIVPGDVIWLQEGEKIPADARVLQSHNLLLNEAALTGESTPVHKIGEELTKEVVLADQTNMVFKGSLVLSGSGTAVVVATGIYTHIGSISASLSQNQGRIPLKKEVGRLSIFIIAIVTIGSILLTLAGLVNGYSLVDMISVSVALAVSVIPEGLPVVLTLILSTGVWRMSKRNALVKKLQAVEGLGQVDVIAVDKTGTITKNQMTLTSLFVGGRLYEVSGTGYNPEGSIKLDGKNIDPGHHHNLLRAAKIAAYCANAQVTLNQETKQWQVTGDPTEAAMLVFAQKAGIDKTTLLESAPQLEELPFNYHAKLHASLSGQNETKLLSVCGAPESIIKACQLSKEDQAMVEEMVEELTSDGLRVVGFAYKQGKLHNIHSHLHQLQFGGLFAMKDPLHEEVSATVKKVTQAGIKVVLITGDHQITARAIAQSASIYKEGDQIISGEELARLGPEELREKLPYVSVFSRVTPEQKMQIISAYQQLGLQIAMTGDGVNDAPSLVAADLGVAMGHTGTEVAKEAADIILLDDNFKSIVAAIEEGRGIYATIRKSINYIFVTSVAEAGAITAAILLQLPLLLQPSQIIWLNFVTDGFLVAALAMEPNQAGLLTNSVRGRHLIDKHIISSMLRVGLLMAAAGLFVFQAYLGDGVAKASTMAMVVLASVQWIYSWSARSQFPAFSKYNLPNPYLVWATLIVIILQILAVHSPLQKILHTVPLSLTEWLIALIPAILIFIFEELRKYWVINKPKPLVQTF